jgi:tetratricopeptide (TPR) repeat protein
MIPYLVPVLTVLLVGLLLDKIRRPSWEKIYLVAWILFAILNTVALSVNIASIFWGDSRENGSYSWIRSSITSKQKNNTDAMTLLNNRINNNPKDDEAYFIRGIAEYNLKEYEKAIVDFSKVIELKPESENAFSSRGSARFMIQDYKGAILDYNRAIQLSDYLGVYHYLERAEIKYLLKDFEGAKADYHRIIELQGMNLTDKDLVYRAFYKKANIEFELEDYESAIFDYTFAIDLNPGTNEKAYFKRGLAYLRSGYNDDACSDFRKASELGNTEVYNLILEHCQ